MVTGQGARIDVAEDEPSPRSPAEGTPRAPVSRGDLVRLWLGLLLPPGSWVFDLLGQYFLTRWANQHARVWPFWLITGAAIGGCAGGALLSWVARRRARARAAERRDHVTMAEWGLALAAYFSLLIAAQAYPVWVLDVRELT
jgi:hypothetical protein